LPDSLVVLAVVVAFMLGELAWSRRNERLLLERGASAPPDPVYATMRWAYPGAFAMMALEGTLRPRDAEGVAVAGLVIFALGKGLKLWAIAALGSRWTYRVFVVPGAPLVSGGPYRFMRHPNYAGVVGELVGMAMMTAALVTGPLGTLFFVWLLRRRIVAEERALAGGIRPAHGRS
jgi:methyltransferase